MKRIIIKPRVIAAVCGLTFVLVPWIKDDCYPGLVKGHTGWVEDVCFSQDQKWIVSASKDKTIRMWNIEKADAIPMVMETKKLTGMRLLSCAQCGKPYSASGVAKGGPSSASSDEANLCVFCRHSRR